MKAAAAAPSADELRSVQLDVIEVRKQVRLNFGEISALAASIASTGYVEPLMVRPGNKQGRFELIAGERRYRALSMLRAEHPTDRRWLVAPCIVKHVDASEAWKLQMQENLERQALTWYELGRALIARRRETGQSLTAVCDSIGISKAAGSRYVSMVEALSSEATELILQSSRLIPLEKAEVYLKRKDGDEQVAAIRLLWGEKEASKPRRAPRNLKRAAVEAMIARLLNEGGTPREVAILQYLLGLRQEDPLSLRPMTAKSRKR